VFKIFLVLVEILRKSMHQFTYIMMDFRRRREGIYWEKMEIFLSVIFFNAKTFEKFAKLSKPQN
jgi:hypothetical protein